jgi:CheY-like chemotaxis protein
MNLNSDVEGTNPVQKRLANSDFIAHLSHELRTPLNAIIGFSQLLKNQLQGNEDQLESAQMIEQAGKHLWQLIDQLIDLVKLEELAELDMEWVELQSLLNECIELIRLDMEEKNISIRFFPSAQDMTTGGYRIYCDPLKLRQILLNLLSNGIKYNQHGGVLTISLLQDSLYTSISIEDNGIGIAQDKLELLFQPFQRLGAEFTEIEGTGLGLSICKEMIELMQGQINCTSQLGQGSCFTIRLPNQGPDLKEQANIKPKGIVTPPTLVNTGLANTELVNTEFKLLYIEDNPTNIRFMQGLLAELPKLSFETAINGEQGLEKANSFQPDIILLDMRLPDMHGLDVLSQLHQQPASQAKVIALSADALPEQVAAAKRAGVDGYLTKPIDLARLHQLLGAEPELKSE